MDHRFVEVEWVDIVCDNSWNKVADMPKPHLCLTRGWIVLDTEDYVLLAGTIGNHQDPTNPPEYNNSIAIPHGVIKTITDLEDEEDEHEIPSY